MRQIVDAHHHLWDLSACYYPWLMARGVRRFFGDPTPIQKNYVVSDLLKDSAEYDLAASVHVQVGVKPGDELKESEWLNQQGLECGLPSAIVFYCSLEDERAPELLNAQREIARVRGVRQIVGRSDDEDAISGSGKLIDHAIWRENLALLGNLGLSFDLQLTPGQIPRVANVLAGAPGTKIALCHCGSPSDQSRSGLATWRQGIELLAALPNVNCKISGLGMFDHNWTVESIRPIVESCIELFGVERCMFGSNFPVDKLYGSYGKIWKAYEEITRDMRDHERHRLFVGTAKQFYRID